jgi:SAC3 family protein LENG8/THP3
MSHIQQVQRIKNDFTVSVYEVHARIALESVRFQGIDCENGGLLTLVSLISLSSMHAKLLSVSYMDTAYKERITNSSLTASSTCCMGEIVLVSFCIFHLHTCHTVLIPVSELNILVSALTLQEKATPEVRHAIAVHMAMATGNYHKFFVLYAKAPNMGGYIVDHYADRERCAALVTIGRAYVFNLLQVSYRYV